MLGDALYWDRVGTSVRGRERPVRGVTSVRLDRDSRSEKDRDPEIGVTKKTDDVGRVRI